MITGGGVPVWLAVVAGFVSFASACVLPIVPGYGVLIAGLTLTEAPGGPRPRNRVGLRYALLFLLGFGALFVLSAATATSVGDWIRGRLQLFEVIGAAAIGILGVALVGRSTLRRAANSLRGRRWTVAAGIASFAAGAGFAAAWTPCIGPVLAEILLYGAFPETLGEGVFLLGLYTLGLLIPFLFVGIAITWLIGRSPRSDSRSPALQGALGVGLLIFSALLLTGRFATMTAYLSGFGLLIEVGL